MKALLRLHLAFALACAPVLVQADGACDHVRVDSAWVRQPPPGMTMTAGYFEIANTGTTTLELNGVSSADFGSAMLHETAQVDGAARMRHLPGITLAPGGHFSAAPGGAHLMLDAPRIDLAAAAQVRFSLLCADGSALEVSAPLLRAAPPTSDQHAHH